MKSQKELWKPDLNLVSQGYQHEKILNFHSGFEPGTPASVTSILTLDQQIRYMDYPQNCTWEDPRWGKKFAKPVNDRQEWQSLVDLNGNNIDLWDTLVSCFGGPVTKYLLLRQGFWVQIQGVKFFSWWHPLEPRFKSGFHNFLLGSCVPDRISWMTLEIYKWNLGTSFG